MLNELLNRILKVVKEFCVLFLKSSSSSLLFDFLRDHRK